ASGFVLPRSLVHGSGETRVAAASAAATGKNHALRGGEEFVNLLAGLFVVPNRPHRNLQNYVFAFPPALVGAFAMASPLRLVFRIEPEMDQRVVAFAGFHDHVSAFAAIAARRAAARNIFLASKGHAAIAAIARFNPNFCLVDKHWLVTNLRRESLSLNS